MTPIPTLPRDELFKAFGDNKRLVVAFEQTNKAVSETQTAVTVNTAATEAIADATVITLSPNASFNNERVLKIGPGISVIDDGEFVTFSVNDDVAHVEGGFRVALTAQGETLLVLPLEGVLATLDGDETLTNKTLADAMLDADEYADDAAAAVGGVPVGGLYLKAGAVFRRAA